MKRPATSLAVTQQHLFMMKMREGEDLKKFLGKYYETASQLKTLDTTFNDTVLVVTLLNALPASYARASGAQFRPGTRF